MNLSGKIFKMAPLVVASLLGSPLAQGAVQENDTVPLDQVVFIDCDGDQVPEDVLLLQGDLHVVTTETVDKAGGLHLTFHYQPINVSAVGDISGDTYRAVGVTRESVTLKGDSVSDTFINNFHMVGRKSGINYIFHEVFHVTVVDGDVVVSLDHVDVECH